MVWCREQSGDVGRVFEVTVAQSRAEQLTGS